MTEEAKPAYHGTSVTGYDRKCIIEEINITGM